ncbi:VRR-NUC domain-containing protein [Aspergillus unguis]
MSLLDYWDTARPSAKRRKTDPEDQVKQESQISESPTPASAAGERSNVKGNTRDENSIQDTLADGDIVNDGRDDGPLPSSQTELESALPAIETDSHAIEEYESSQQAEEEKEQEKESVQQERMRSGRWRKGKSSIYVDAFNLALDTVLDEEEHLFSLAEKEVFRHWRELNYEAQYLYVRLFLRKTSAWFRVNRLGYYSDVADVPSVVKDLQKTRTLTAPVDEQTSPWILSSDSEKPGLGSEFRFADTIDEITTVEEASSLLLLDELKVLAKEAKVQGKTKQELIQALHQTSQKQTSLGWNSTSDSPSREEKFLNKILDYTGDCIRLAAGPYALFERVHLVFYRSTEWTEKSLTTIILAKISRRNFPEYVVCRSSSIFPSREILLEFESALRTQSEIDNILEFNGTPSIEQLNEIKDFVNTIHPRWKDLLQQEQNKEDTIYECGEGAYLRRFSPAWVYTRILHKGLYPLARFKEYKEEHRLLSELLDQRLFHPARRGAWYQRKALLEEHYMWALSPYEGRTEEAQRKHWRRIALRTCEEGLEDPSCHLMYHYDLQKRIRKLEKALKVVKREQHDFGHVALAKPEERTVYGIQIEREDTPAPAPDFVKDKAKDKDEGNGTPKRSGPTVWLDELENGAECRVEAMCLSWYRQQGWKGFHSEGGILRTLFAYLFYDILFTYIPNVFQTDFQTCPLDLHTDAFYPSRASEINHRLVQITNGEAGALISSIHAQHSATQPCAIGLDWSFELCDLLEIAECFRGEALAAICKIMAQEYQARGGGVPDLFLWRTDTKEVCFVEVKSANDRLSDTQRLWIHVLIGAGVKVELCAAVAREVRRV